MKKYNGSTWVDTTLRQYKTATTDIESTIYSDGSPITSYTIKGNTVQSGTPTPTNPIAVNGVGELDSGQYKIPISSGGVTTNIYLGSTASNRCIKKLVLDGTENIVDTTGYFAVRISTPCMTWTASVCNYGTGVSGDNSGNFIWFSKNVFTQSSVSDFKTFLTQRYDDNAPVVVWYVVATPYTDIINEPLMRIGNAIDSISNAAQIPTTEGANSITVDTTVQPSEFTATWTGWHDSSVKEWDGSQWQ